MELERIPVLAVFLAVACVSAPQVEPQVEPAPLVEKTIDYVLWSDDVPYWGEHFGEPVILGHVVERDGARAFTARVDKVFSIEAEGYRGELRHGTGGVSNARDFYIVLRPGRRGLEEGREYTLRPRNSVAGVRWRVPDEGLVLVR